MKLKLIFLLSFLIVFLGLGPNDQNVLANSYKSYPSVVDNAGLISRDSQKVLLTYLHNIEKKHGIRCAVMTVKSTQGMDTRSFSNAVHDKYYSDSKTGSILMVIDMEKKRWHITTDYRMRKKITDDMVIGVLKDSFINDLKNGNYGKAFFAYGKKVDQLLSK